MAEKDDLVDLLYDDNAFGAADSYENLTGLATDQKRDTSEINVDLSHTDLYSDKRRNSVSLEQQRQQQQQGQISTDGYATSALYVSGLAWWRTDLELQKFAEKAGQEKQLKAVVFLEHRINGKSRGLAYMEFVDYASATKVKEFIERWNLAVAFVHPSQIGNSPFKNMPLQDSAGKPLDIENASQQASSRPASSMQDRRYGVISQPRRNVVMPAATKKVASKKPASKTFKSASAKTNVKDLITKAIVALKDRNGSTPQAIQNYVKANFKVDEKKFANEFKTALKRGVKSGSFSQTKNGPVKLIPVAAASPKKPAVVKKAAAKKAKVAKKATGSPKKKPAAKKAKKVVKSKKPVSAKKPASPQKPASAKPKSAVKKPASAPKSKKPASPASVKKPVSVKKPASSKKPASVSKPKSAAKKPVSKPKSAAATAAKKPATKGKVSSKK